MRIHKLPDSPVEIRELGSNELLGFKPVPSEVLQNRWVCLQDIIEALQDPDPWNDPGEAYEISVILKEEILNG